MKTMRFAARANAFLGVAFIGFLFFGTFSTGGWEFTSGWWQRSLAHVATMSLVAGALMAPVSWLPFIGCSVRVIGTGMLAVPVFTVVAAEAFGRVQEWVVLQEYGLVPSKAVHVDRWWPFEHHEIAFVPNHGWMGWD